MIVRPDMRRYRVLDILIEFKFVSLKEAEVDGKTLERMDDAAPAGPIRGAGKTARSRGRVGALSGEAEPQIRRCASPARFRRGGSGIRAAGEQNRGTVGIFDRTLFGLMGIVTLDARRTLGYGQTFVIFEVFAEGDDGIAAKAAFVTT